MDHGVGLRQQPCGIREIGVQPRTEAFGLADIDDPPVRIPEPVNAWVGRNLTRLGPVGRWICHGSSLLRRSDTPCRMPAFEAVAARTLGGFRNAGTPTGGVLRLLSGTGGQSTVLLWL